MDFYRDFINKLGGGFASFEAFFKAHPNLIWLLMSIIFIPLGIGSVLGKNWAIDPNSNEQRFWYKIVGHKTFGIVVGIIFLLGGVASLVVFFMRYIISP